MIIARFVAAWVATVFFGLLLIGAAAAKSVVGVIVAALFLAGAILFLASTMRARNRALVAVGMRPKKQVSHLAAAAIITVWTAVMFVVPAPQPTPGSTQAASVQTSETSPTTSKATPATTSPKRTTTTRKPAPKTNGVLGEALQVRGVTITPRPETIVAQYWASSGKSFYFGIDATLAGVEKLFTVTSISGSSFKLVTSDDSYPESPGGVPPVSLGYNTGKTPPLPDELTSDTTGRLFFSVSGLDGVPTELRYVDKDEKTLAAWKIESLPETIPAPPLPYPSGGGSNGGSVYVDSDYNGGGGGNGGVCRRSRWC